MLTTPLDVPYILGWDLPSQQKPVVQKQLFVDLEDEEKIIYNYLKESDKQQLDMIAINCELPIFKVASILLNFELKGLIRPLPGKLFEII